MSRLSLTPRVDPGQDDPRGSREVEGVDDPGGGDADEAVAELARQPAQPPVLLAEHEDGPAGEVHPVQVLGARLAGGAVDPETLVLEAASQRQRLSK